MSKEDIKDYLKDNLSFYINMSTEEQGSYTSIRIDLKVTLEDEVIAQEYDYVSFQT